MPPQLFDSVAKSLPCHILAPVFKGEMGKTGKWIKRLLTGKKGRERHKDGNRSFTLPADTQSAPTPKEKRRWSFRRATAPGKEASSSEMHATEPVHGFSDSEIDKKTHVMAVATSTMRAANIAVDAKRVAASSMLLATTVSGRTIVTKAAAIKIQAIFRSYLARKALYALRGIVKLQALVRGHLVRKQATATLRCMKALIAVQTRVREQRISKIQEAQTTPQRQLTDRRSPQLPHCRQSHMDRNAEENAKIVEMDLGEAQPRLKSRDTSSVTPTHNRRRSKIDAQEQVSPAPSALTDMSPRTYSGRFEEFSFTTAESSPRNLSAIPMHATIRASLVASRHERRDPVINDYPFFPNYMANTESSRAKARSQSAPKQRSDACERQQGKRRASMERRNIPLSIRMQRSTSLVSSTANGYHYPWSIKLDRSNASLIESEYGSTSTVLTKIKN